ncbi:MAG: hypothetical protein GY730_04930 [bacterium]|nr:hypothetical protein [bacterium]
MKKYHTDEITNICCNHYNEVIESKQVAQELIKFSKEDLVEYLSDVMTTGKIKVSDIPEQK